MKRIALLLCSICIVCTLCAFSSVAYENAVDIVLSDDQITVNGSAISTDTASDVYAANDIVYYEAGKDFTYGEGGEGDAHEPAEAAAHTVVHITKPGTYRIEGKLSRGQIAVDLGDDAKDDPNAVVTLILNGMDITCEVAPAVIFYNVYECGSDDADTASKDVDTSSAGANIVIADDTVNTVNGSYVARIYKPGTVVLNADGTAVEDAKKLHKYDAAFYSKMSMNVSGESNGSGKLLIHADNEGLDSELHLTIHGGIIDITAGNDGINTTEDGVSVTTIGGGELTIHVTGETGEGDGIDSNGWLVINGGIVRAYACAWSGDAGIDSDMGIHINGGTVLATGNMLDRIAGTQQNCAVFHFKSAQTADAEIELKGADTSVLHTRLQNPCSVLIFSSPDLKEGNYELYVSGIPYGATQGGGMGNMEVPPGGAMPEGQEPPAMPEGERPPAMPEGGAQPPMGGDRPGDRPNGQMPSDSALSKEFAIKAGVNTFYAVGEYAPDDDTDGGHVDGEHADGGNNHGIVWIVVGVVIAGLVIYGVIVTAKLFKKKN